MINGRKNIAKEVIFLHLLLAAYSFCGVFSKLASSQNFLSWKFCLYYAGELAILIIYAIGWQQILKKIPLTTAFANKAITIIWGSVWGILLFGETMSWGKFAGIALIVVGVILFTTDNTEADNG